MSNYMYVTKEDKLKALSTYKNHKSLFELVEFQSVGRWKIKPKRQDENAILYLLYKIQNYCLENKLDTYLTTLKVKCLCSYILLYDSNENDYKAVFCDLNIQPYGFFYSSIERFLKKTTYFDNNGVVDIIISPEKVKNKKLIDLKFDKVLLKNKEDKSGKVNRREYVKKHTQLIMLFGDNLSDFDVFSSKSIDERDNKVEELAKEFGDSVRYL